MGCVREHQRPHLRFKALRSGAVAATRTLIDARPRQLTDPQRREAFTTWATKMSDLYRVDVPVISWVPRLHADNGFYGLYSSESARIFLDPMRPSIITLAHEYRHHLQSNGARLVCDDIEHDAQGWSMSLHYSAHPQLFARLVRAGQVAFIDPAALRRITGETPP